MRTKRVLSVAGHLVVWLALTVGFGLVFFLNSSASTTVASHDAVLKPTLDGYVTVHTGPFLPDVRQEADGRFGVDVNLGKTEAFSTDELVARYAFIASEPGPQIAQVTDAVQELVYAAALRGAVTAALPLAAWGLIGPARRRQLLGRPWREKAWLVGGAALLVVLTVVAWEPWEDHEPTLSDTATWERLPEYVTEVRIPDEARDLEISGNLTTDATKRLVLSAVDSYAKSKEFYARAREAAMELELRQPAEDETVAVLVSDRHDNIGMDRVVREIGDQAGATAILDAGDDTSTGSEWEAFSLDSLDAAFDDYDQRFAVAGNHDHGGFVASYLDELGWTTASEDPVEGPGGGLLLGVDDPRSSGLGNWRDEPGLSIPELAVRIADEACGSEERVNTLLVHDADMGTEALERGCVDLVVSGHLHVQVGPDRVVGEAGVGYAYTNGTTGGAAYAVAVGSKLRRPAEVTLLTYREGRPVGIQPVMLQTNGVFEVGDFVPLTLDDPVT